MSSPISVIVLLPSIIGPVSISIISDILIANDVLVATFMVGQTGFPVGVPNPVVNNIKVAPEAAFPVVASTSFPGVQTKLRPASLLFQYNPIHPLPERDLLFWLLRQIL